MDVPYANTTTIRLCQMAEVSYIVESKFTLGIKEGTKTPGENTFN